MSILGWNAREVMVESRWGRWEGSEREKWLFCLPKKGPCTLESRVRKECRLLGEGVVGVGERERE